MMTHFILPVIGFGKIEITTSRHPNSFSFFWCYYKDIKLIYNIVETNIHYSHYN